MEETGATFAANAALKARAYARLSGLPTLADDSGLEVDHLGGGPGVRTRRYAGEQATDEDEQRQAPGRARQASRRSAAARATGASSPSPCRAAAGPRGGLPVHLARGTFEGRIGTARAARTALATTPSSSRRREPPGGATVGEWPPERKQAVSHRARAARRMAPHLAREGF